MKFISTLIISALFLFTAGVSAFAQQSLAQDYSQLMEIPNISALEGSPTHLYVLSETEGMAVFRAYPDTLQWLYTSSGMQRRGNKIMADIRFILLLSCLPSLEPLPDLITVYLLHLEKKGLEWFR